jgi:hypothetical protein
MAYSLRRLSIACRHWLENRARLPPADDTHIVRKAFHRFASEGADNDIEDLARFLADGPIDDRAGAGT